MKLTELTCKNAKPFAPPSKSPRKLADGHGLYLWVMPSGTKYWRYKYKKQGKEQIVAIGVYPEVSLKEARNKRAEYRKMRSDGLDPVQAIKKSKVTAEVSAANTFEKIALEWYENRKDIWKPRYADDVVKRLKEDIFPFIGAMPIKEIEPPILLEVIRKIEKRGAIDLAKRQLQKSGEIFRYAVATGRATRDPSQDIKEALKPRKTEHFASIEVEELPEFLAALDANVGRSYLTTHNAMKLMLLTFVRTSELINARWDEFDFDKKRWIIPGSRMKMGVEHIVPLATQAMEILISQQDKYGQWEHVFPSPIKPKISISNNTILGGLKRMGYQGRMTGHGFRSLAMGGIKQELGYRHEVIDRQLAHIPQSKVNKAYDRAAFLVERTEMMQAWANYLDKLRDKNAQR